MSIKIDDLKLEYKRVCEKYIDIFCKKQDVEFDGWVANVVGETANFGDYTINFTDVKLDVNNEIEQGLIFSWYNEVAEHPKRYINYYSYTRGLRCSDIKDY